jgi:hypothetical protein
VDADVGVAEEIGEEQVVRPYAVAVTKGIVFSRRWYRDITEFTRSVGILGSNVEECVEEWKKRGNTTADTPHTHGQAKDTAVTRR